MTADAVGGVWTYALELRRQLARHDVEVYLATMGPPPPAVDENVRVSTFRLEWEPDPWQDVARAAAWLLELEEELRPDVVHLNGYAHGSLPWTAPVLVAAHSDVVSWWWAVHGCAPPARYAPYRAAVASGLAAAQFVVAPTQAVLDDLGLHFRLPGACAVIPNGRRSETAAAAPKEPYVAGLGRFWDESKNISALERVRSATPWPIVLAGDGTELGRLSPAEAAALLERAAVFASPARYEPFGLAILEAALAGCALLLGDIPSLREVWGDAAVFVSPDDDAAIAAGLRLLTGDDELRRKLAERAGRRARRYTPELMGERYAAAYADVMETAAVAA